VSRVTGALRAVVKETAGLLVDDWRLAGGVVAVLGISWWAVSRGAAGATGYVVALALAVVLAGVAIIDGRARARADARLDSKPGGRIPDRDP